MKVTLGNLHEATAQQVFDQVLNHLREQGKQSRCEITKGCVYRSDAGLKCAAGALIADDEYKTTMDCDEDTSWVNLETLGLVPRTEHSEMIVAMQNTHDSYGPHYKLKGKTFVDYIDEQFEGLAKDFNLEYKA